MVLVDLGLFCRKRIGIDSYLGNRLFVSVSRTTPFLRYISVFFIFEYRRDIDTTTTPDIMGGGPALTRQEVAKVQSTT